MVNVLKNTVNCSHAFNYYMIKNVRSELLMSGFMDWTWKYLKRKIWPTVKVIRYIYIYLCADASIARVLVIYFNNNVLLNGINL